MKKYLLLLITMVMSLTICAQWSAGARVGANFSSITGKWSDQDESNTKWIGGPVGGVVGGYSFNDMWSLRGEFLYLTMGEKTVYSEDEIKALSAQGYYFREIYNCMQMVFLAQALFNINLLTIYANTGFFMTRKFNGRWRTENANGPIFWGTNNSRSLDDTYYVDPEYNRRWDYGMYIGGGVGKELGPGRLELDLRFGFGLIDLNKFDSKEDKQDAIDNGYRPYRSMNFTVSIAYLYLFDKK